MNEKDGISSITISKSGWHLRVALRVDSSTEGSPESVSVDVLVPQSSGQGIDQLQRAALQRAARLLEELATPAAPPPG